MNSNCRFVIISLPANKKPREPRRLRGREFAVCPNPARPYSLPVASVSNESVSREIRFMVGLCAVIGHNTPSTLSQPASMVNIAVVRTAEIEGYDAGQVRFEPGHFHLLHD